MQSESPEIIEDLETEWKPNHRQAEALAMPTSIDEGFYGGAAGGGKTEYLIMDPIVRQYHLHPRFHAIIFRETYPELQESVLPRAKYLYGKYGGALWNDNDKEFRFPSGAIVRLSYLLHDDDAHKHQSSEYNYIGFDELTHFSEYRYLYMKSRNRSAVEGLPAYMRAGSNPGGPGHTWVYKRFVEPAEQGHVLLRYLLPNGKYNRRMFIPAKLTDNPAMMRNNPEYESNLMTLPEAEKRALLYGDWHAFSGQVFSEFRAKRLPFGEPDNALHVIEPIEIPEWWPKIIVCDWGWSAMTWVGWGAISPDGRVYIYREFTCRKTYIEVWASDIARLSQFDGNVKAHVLDPSAWQERGEPKTIHQQITEATGWSWERALNDRVGGKLALHEMLRWTPRPPARVTPEGFNEEMWARIFRMHGEKAAEQYRASFTPRPPETNLPKLQIFNTCPQLISAIQACVPKKSNPEDVEEWDGDDPYDGVRYLIKRCEKYLHEAQVEQKRRQTLEKVLTQFQNDGDMTAFYRRMEKLDADLAKKLVPLRRIHAAPGTRGFGANRLSRISASGKHKVAWIPGRPN